MPTIYDVAKRAGVAPATVSRVINESGYVSEDTRLRVQAAIDDLGYAPNRLARGLRSKQTQTLGLVVTDITNPFWTTVARGVEDAASRHGFSVILCNTDESEAKQEQYVNLLLEKQVDGFLLVPATDDVRAVAIDNPGTASGIPYLAANSVNGGFVLAWIDHAWSGPEHHDAMAQIIGVFCAADVNIDGMVDIDDVFAVLAAWGACGDPDDCPADVNGDDVVDIDDLFDVLAAWGPCP